MGCERSPKPNSDVVAAPDAETALPDLLTCALTVFVVDPFRLLADPAPFVPLISLNGSAIIVVNGSTPNPVDLQSLRQRLAKQIGATQFPQTLIQVDASRALVANDLLRKALSAEPDASTSIRAANLTSSQSSFQLSQVPALQKAILDSVQACPANAAGRRVFQLSIEAIERTIQNDMSSCFDLERDLTAFRQHIQGVEDRARCLAHDLDPRLDMRGLPEAPLEDKSIQALFTSRWTWLDLIFRARFDELSTRLIGYLRADFGTKEEQIVSKASASKLIVSRPPSRLAACGKCRIQCPKKRTLSLLVCNPISLAYIQMACLPSTRQCW